MMAQTPVERADLVVANARIHTVEPSRPTASALAVRGGRILYVGDDASPYIGPATRRIDAHGATIVPGFIDSHGHMQGLGELLQATDLRYVKSVAEVAEMVRKQAASLPPGTWIQGQNWNETNWGGKFPNADDLTRVAPNNPVFLSRVDGHAAWVNRKALEIAGITANTPDPPGGKIHKDKSGTPTGILVDNAQDLVAAKIPPASPEMIRSRLARAARECASVGLTTVHDAGIGRAEVEAYRDLIARHELPVRIYAMIAWNEGYAKEWLLRGPEIGDRFTVRSFKLMSDGALGSRGAAMLEPFADDPGNTGLLMLKKDDIERIALAAIEHGFQVNTHAIGDRANRTVAEAYGAVLNGKNDRRFRIEHAQVVAPPDFALFAKYSIVASMQATHATSDMRFAEKRLGSERVKGAYAWRRFLSEGVPIPNGSDFPVEEPNPLYGFYAAITREDRQGNPKGGWFPDQRMTRDEALKSWTITGAWAAFQEDKKGSLAPGKLADFVMLSSDIMKVPPPEILKTRVLMTVLGGEIVYQAPQQ